MKKIIFLFVVLIFTLSLNSVGKPRNLNNKQFIFKESHIKKLNEIDFMNLGYRQPTLETLAIARNEIFARKGYKFGSEKYKNYFNSKKWYKPKTDNNSIILNNVEEYNVSLIKYYEFRFEKKYYIPKNTHPNTYKKGNVVLIDLDGNGIKDSITFNTDHQTFQLTVNDIAINGQGDCVIDSFAIVDIDTRDKVKEIVISELGPSDDPNSTFFFYNGTEIKQIGKVYSLFYRGIAFDGLGIINVRSRGTFLQTWFFDIPYHLNKNHILIKIPDQIYKTDHSLFLKQSLKIYFDRDENSDFTIIEPTTIITIIGTDNKKWCFVETENGIKGWFFVDNYYFINGTGVEAFKIFYGLSYAD